MELVRGSPAAPAWAGPAAAKPALILKTARSYVTTPSHLASLWGKFYIYTGKGQLSLETNQLTFTEGQSLVVIPLTAIRDLDLGRYSLLTKPTGLDFIRITFEEQGMVRCLCFTPNQGPFQPVWDTNVVVAEWFGAIQRALAAATGRPPAKPAVEPSLPESKPLDSYAAFFVGAALVAGIALVLLAALAVLGLLS